MDGRGLIFHFNVTCQNCHFKRDLSVVMVVKMVKENVSRRSGGDLADLDKKLIVDECAEERLQIRCSDTTVRAAQSRINVWK